jgi:hypothetical protein
MTRTITIEERNDFPRSEREKIWSSSVPFSSLELAIAPSLVLGICQMQCEIQTRFAQCDYSLPRGTACDLLNPMRSMKSEREPYE